MNVALAAMLSLGIAQPPAPDYYPYNSRKIEFPIQFPAEKIKNTRQLELHVSNDGGQVWQLAAVAPPTQKTFKYTAPSDGRYWFHIRTEDLKGNKEPANLTLEPPSMKLLFDTKPPTVTFTNVSRNDREVLIEWKIDDQFPDEEATHVSFRALSASDQEWHNITLPAKKRGGVKFDPRMSGPIVVRVQVADLVGHRGEGLREIAAPTVTMSTSLSPASPPPSAATPASAVIPPPELGPIGPLGPVAPSVPPSIPVAPTAPPVSPPAAPAAPPVVIPPAAPAALAPVPPPATLAAPPSESRAPTAPTPSSSLPTFDPRNNLTPAAGTHPTPGPVIETSRAPVVSTLRFDLNYRVETRGPSGISRVDLWVTRDDGKSWVWWSQHDGREPAVKVNLATSSNAQPEGLYGFRLVPVSGAGLSDAAPTAGDTPDMRLIVDVSAPNVKIFPAIADPNDPNSLVLQWEATDKNFGDDPIALEWCEGPGGPWKPVATTASSDAAGVAAKRLPNTGKYSWHVPNGLPPRVYLKVTAKDSAGNITEQVTRDPILIDLTKPRAKITGLGTAAGPLPIIQP